MLDHRRMLTLSLVIIFILTSCGYSSNLKTENTNDQQDQFIRLNTNSAANQLVSNKAKKLIIKFDEIKAVQAVNSKEKLVVAIEIDHLKRFNLKKIKKKIQKVLKKEISDIDIIVSTDKKISLELEKMERTIETKELSEKKIKKQLKKIIELSEEQT